MPAKGWKVGTSIVGDTYGMWRVLAPSDRSDKRNKFWLCVCECGTFRELNTSRLRRRSNNARPPGCGCNVLVHGFPAKRLQPHDDRVFNARYIFYRRRAETKLQTTFALTLAQFAELCKSNCYYCGAPPAMAARMGLAKPGEPLSNGVDRIDNNYGYIMENVVPCCTYCNQMKLDRSTREFLEQVERIAAHSIKNI